MRRGRTEERGRETFRETEDMLFSLPANWLRSGISLKRCFSCFLSDPRRCLSAVLQKSHHGPKVLELLKYLVL